ncbi:gamma-aminobutyric acid receptor alpha-like [Caerostris extrusa]|uniref:Gamma-aminobutyric acid receptor alpha-like n=1 Tax=Caerostris extrusa TaxID=172846 RepID=A0AAV4UDG6_CAEEX|nr:gamma-aminobutyric acid receptor alpha-like [Caerostris extrusa]
MDCYFRQSWVDKRLAYSSNMPFLALSISMLERIWKPDTYFYNGKNSYLHTITTPNKFVRLYRDGRVLYSSRLTIRASCPMRLENFPMDVQRCPLQIGSFGYSDRDIQYRWNPLRSVVIAPDMKLSMFDVTDTPTGNLTEMHRKGPFSVLVVSFHLKRHMGYFVIEVYAPAPCWLCCRGWRFGSIEKRQQTELLLVRRLSDKYVRLVVIPQNRETFDL